MASADRKANVYLVDSGMFGDAAKVLKKAVVGKDAASLQEQVNLLKQQVKAYQASEERAVKGMRDVANILQTDVDKINNQRPGV